VVVYPGNKSLGGLSGAKWRDTRAVILLSLISIGWPRSKH
jgi:hypothetical protein